MVARCSPRRLSIDRYPPSIPSPPIRCQNLSSSACSCSPFPRSLLHCWQSAEQLVETHHLVWEGKPAGLAGQASFDEELFVSGSECVLMSLLDSDPIIWNGLALLLLAPHHLARADVAADDAKT